MGVLLIIVFTPLAIALGLIVLKLAFKPIVWLAFGGLTLAALVGVAIVAAIPKPSRPAPEPIVFTPPAPVSEAEKAERRAIEASGIDYPYVRGYAAVALWTKTELDEKLRLARFHKVPQTAVYPEAKEYYGWRLLDDIENPDLRRGVIKLATYRRPQ